MQQQYPGLHGAANAEDSAPRLSGVQHGDGIVSESLHIHQSMRWESWQRSGLGVGVQWGQQRVIVRVQPVADSHIQNVLPISEEAAQPVVPL